MLVTLRGQRVKGILVSMSLGIPLISFGNMPSKHLFPSIVILLSASLTCKAKSLAQIFFSIIFFSFGEEAKISILGGKKMASRTKRQNSLFLFTFT